MLPPRRSRAQSPRLLDVRRRQAAPRADVMPQVSGRADGSVVSQLVKEKLA